MKAIGLALALVLLGETAAAQPRRLGVSFPDASAVFDPGGRALDGRSNQEMLATLREKLTRHGLREDIRFILRVSTSADCVTRSDCNHDALAQERLRRVISALRVPRPHVSRLRWRSSVRATEEQSDSLELLVEAAEDMSVPACAWTVDLEDDALPPPADGRAALQVRGRLWVSGTARLTLAPPVNGDQAFYAVLVDRTGRLAAVETLESGTSRTLTIDPRVGGIRLVASPTRVAMFEDGPTVAAHAQARVRGAPDFLSPASGVDAPPPVAQWTQEWRQEPGETVCDIGVWLYE